MREYTHRITEDIVHPIRLSDYIFGIFPLLPSRASIKKALKRNEIWIDQRVACSGDYVRKDMLITHRVAYPDTVNDASLDIVYEDDYLILINKPPGILSSGNGKVSIQKQLSNKIIHTDKVDALLFPKIIHRLDRDTTGLIIAAKTKSVHLALSRMLEQHFIHKHYIAIVEGEIIDRHLIENEINGKYAKTIIEKGRVLRTKDPTSLINICIETGRTHQIRIHLKEIGHPIVGDNIYNKEGLFFGRGLFLQAYRVSFQHPELDTYLEVKIPLHKKFSKYI